MFFFRISSERGGGLAESKISLAEKTEIFLDFFAERGGGSHPIQKGFSRKKWVLAEKTEIFWIFCPKGGGVSPNPKGFYQKKLRFFRIFSPKGGGVWPNPKFP